MLFYSRCGIRYAKPCQGSESNCDHLHWWGGNFHQDWNHVQDFWNEVQVRWRVHRETIGWTWRQGQYRVIHLTITSHEMCTSYFLKQTKITREGNKLIQEHLGDNPATIIREVEGDKLTTVSDDTISGSTWVLILIFLFKQVCKAGEVVSTRVYKRVWLTLNNDTTLH